jgi:hypothetical protein
MTSQPTRTDPYQLTTETILTHLEQGVIPWRCPWQRTVGRPRNFHSDREYQGVNALLLGLAHFPSPWWLTFRQADDPDYVPLGVPVTGDYKPFTPRDVAEAWDHRLGDAAVVSIEI